MLCGLEYSADAELIEATDGTFSKSYCDDDGCGSVVDCPSVSDVPPAYHSDQKCLTWYSI